jgi:chromosome partitioning protein
MILVFASSKGGVGKSTSCAAIGAALALRGERVLIMDLDPNKTLVRWSKKASVPGLKIDSVPSEKFVAAFQAAKDGSRYDHILIDVMGGREVTMIKALGRADLVVIPAQPSEPDIREALVVVSDVEDMGQGRGGRIPYKVLLTKLYPLRTKVTDHAYAELARQKIPVFKTALVERTAYREMFLTGEPVSSIDRKGAGSEVASLIDEIEVMLKVKQKSTRKAKEYA